MTPEDRLLVVGRQVREQGAPMGADRQRVPEADVVPDSHEQSLRLDAIDDDDVGAITDSQTHRLARLVHQRAHRGQRKPPHFKTAAGTCTKFDQRNAELEATRLRVAEHEPLVREGFQEAVEDRAVEAGSSRQLCNCRALR